MPNPLAGFRISGSLVLVFSLAVVSQFAQAQQAQAPQTPAAQTDEQKNLSSQYAKLSEHANGGGPAPRRDLSGAWAGPVAANTSVPVPMTPLGKKMFSLNKPEGPQSEPGTQVPVALSNDPLRTCDPEGVPRDVTFEDRAIQFVQTPTAMWEMFQYQQIWREIWTDGRKLPTNVGKSGGPDPRYYGFSVGHWDGDYTFVVDTVGTDPGTWIDNAGHPHTGDLQVEERYRRVDHNDLELTVTIDDPKFYTKPFVITKYTLKWIPTQEFEEQLCIPSVMLRYDQLLAVPAGDPNAAKR
jgi:hypothetical protein